MDRNAPADELDKETDKLMDEWQKVGAKMYQETGGTPPPGENPFGGDPQGGPSSDGGEDVVEGEYRSV